MGVWASGVRVWGVGLVGLDAGTCWTTRDLRRSSRDPQSHTVVLVLSGRVLGSTNASTLLRVWVQGLGHRHGFTSGGRASVD